VTVAEGAGMPGSAGRYGGLFSDSYAKFNSSRTGHKSAAGSGSLVEALNEASSPASGGNRSDCGDGVTSSPLAISGATGQFCRA